MDSRSIRRGRKIRSQQAESCIRQVYPSEPNEKLRNSHSFSQYLPNPSMPRAVKNVHGQKCEVGLEFCDKE